MNNNPNWLLPDWPAPGNIHAAFTLRTGGASTGEYATLNPASHVGDDAETVWQNRQTIKHLLNLPTEPHWLTQIHSNFAIKAEANGAPVQADASYSDQPGVVCAVMTADCLPLLVCSKDGAELAAIHAGWRGLLDGIIDNAIALFQSRNLMAWLGPAIGPEQFEVGAEVLDAYRQKSQNYTAAFRQITQDKWLADIYALARTNLHKLGIDDIYGGQYCTVSNPEKFYSYRRDKITGRMAALIWRD